MVPSSFVLLIFSTVILEYNYCYECEQLPRKNCERINRIIAKICDSKAISQSVVNDCIALPYKKAVHCIKAHCSNTLQNYPIKSRSAAPMSNLTVSNNTIPEMYRTDDCAECKENMNVIYVDAACAVVCDNASCFFNGSFALIIMVLRYVIMSRLM